MTRILLYIFIISLGFILSKYKIIPLYLKSKTAILQCFSLFFLLGIMGYKIGSDNNIISEFPRIGMQAFTISLCSILGSIFITKLFFMKKIGGKSCLEFFYQYF